jgi:hypothetical protein
MGSYDGFEPHVGEVQAVRTFRIGPGGTLYALFSDLAWADGTNTAACRASRPASARADPHPVPDPDCSCGFYAYATAESAAEYPHTRHVLAVVSCWGHIIAGTRGLRAEHASIDAIWMSATVPPDLAAQVSQRYPSVSTYPDLAAMLAGHPPTELDCYEPDTPREHGQKRIWLRLAIFAALVIGVLPTHWLGGNHDARAVWAAAVAFFLVASIVLRRRSTDAAGKRQSLLFAAVTLWLVAPFAGAAGLFLLRFPLIEIVAITAIQQRRNIRAASTFPAVIT